MDASIGVDYMLVDLDVVRAEHLIEDALEQGREQLNYDGVTTFTWVTLGELDRAGAIIDLNVPILPEAVPHVWRDYERICNAQSRAVGRGQLTESEATFLLEFHHGIATLMGWR